MSTMTPAGGELLTPLQQDLLAMLQATRDAERALFGALPPEHRDEPMPGESWSPRDVQAHLSAWRGIEARRLAAAAGRDTVDQAEDPLPGDPLDEANQRLHARHSGIGWHEIDALADASVQQLTDAIRTSSTEALCECDQLAAGIGANGINHAIGHLSDIARLAGDDGPYRALAVEIERVLHGSHLPPRDAGVMLYNLACHSALAGDLEGARRRLRTAFARRPDLVDWARQDPDVVELRHELADLATRS